MEHEKHTIWVCFMFLVIAVVLWLVLSLCLMARVVGAMGLLASIGS